MGAICFIQASQILKERGDRNAFLNLLVWAITALAVASMLQKYLSPGKLFGLIPIQDNVVGTMYYKNQFAALMELAAPIALWKVFRGQTVAGGLAFAAMFAATITSESRMGVVLVLAEFLVFLVIMVIRRHMPLRTAVSGAAILALLVTAGAMVAGTDKILQRLEEPDAYAFRRRVLDSTLRMIPAHRWVGSGLGTWPSEYPAFATYDDGTFVNEAHNDWAQWASEGGIPFALLLAALTLWLAGPSFRSIWGLGLLGVMIHSFEDYPLRDPSLSFLWFALAGALTRLESRRSDPENQLIKPV
jgi:O-antigen ligase